MQNEIIELIGKIDRYGNEESEHEDGDYYVPDMLSIGGDVLCKLRFNYKEEIYITYYISDVELTKEEFIENRLLTVIGSPSVRYNHVFGSEWTGYMFTEQGFKVGGHDLYKELNSHNGKYCYLVIYTKPDYREKRLKDILKDG